MRLLLLHLKKEITSRKTPQNQLQLTPNQLQLFQASLNRSFSRHKACNRMPSQHSYRAVSCVSCCSTSRKKSHQKNTPKSTATDPKSIATLSGLSQSFILQAQGLQSYAFAALVQSSELRLLLLHLKKEITSRKTPPNQLQLTPNQLQLFQASLNRSFSRHKACNRMPSQHSYRAVSCVSCCSTSRKKSHQEKHPQINCN